MANDLTAERQALFALTLVSGLGPRLLRALVDHFGSAQAALAAPASQLSQVPHIGADLARKFRTALDSLRIEDELALLDRHGVHVAFLGEPGYPAALAAIRVPPPLLYVRGTLTEQDANAIGIVGSRHCTAYGRRIAEQLAADLARAGWTVVSGLARGIDGAAHRGALKAGGRTLAVLAGGLSSIYPPEHADLAAEISGTGALITEFHMRMEPLPVLFPSRNRIISGLSRAVVVAEANQRSGALITVKHALEQNRDVFAVPGPVDSPASAGTLQLLRDGARVARNADDILEDLRGITPQRRFHSMPGDGAAPVEASLFDGRPAPPPAAAPVPELDDTQRKVWEFLAGPPRSPDEMIQDLGLNPGQLAVLLMTLEMKKVVRRLPGNRYERC
jgi:DNA processing protein